MVKSCQPAAQNEQWWAAAKSVVTCDCNGTSESTLVPWNEGQGSRRDDGLPVRGEAGPVGPHAGGECLLVWVEQAGSGKLG